MYYRLLKVNQISPRRSCNRRTQGTLFYLFGNWEFLKSINRKKVAHSAISFVFWCIWVFSQRYIFVSVFVSGFDQLLELVQGHSVYAGSEIIFIYEDDFIMGQIDTGTAGEFDHQETEFFVEKKTWTAIGWNMNCTTEF